MMKSFRRLLPALLLVSATTLCAHAQFYKLHGGSLSVGGTGLFTRDLTSSPTNVPVSGTLYGSTVSTVATGQQQFTELAPGFLASLQFHPVSWAGLEVNYGYAHYYEQYNFNYVATPNIAAQSNTLRVKPNWNEATAAYIIHPRHIPFQPFLGVGGGAIDFLPRDTVNQWRGTGLLELGFDIPASKHIGFRVEGRGLFYRAPNFYQPVISTRAWRATAEPALSAYYRF